MKKLILSIPPIILFLLLTGCTAQLPGPEQPEVEVVEPTLTPAPAPPLVIRTAPEPGEEQPLDAPLEITFDQPMERASVERAFAIEPGASVDGVFEWVDDETVRFSLADGFERGQRYRVRITESAQSEAGLTMTRPFELRFSAVGALEVATVQPENGTDEVLPDTLVTVAFNRPVAPLESIDEAAGLPDPLTFTPPVTGQGEWLNTSIYQFRPDDGFAPATEYTARVSQGLTDALGNAVLEDDFTWSFTTVTPQAVASLPANGDIYVSPSPVISVTFNQPMNRASVEEKLVVRRQETGQVVAGQFRWAEEGLELPVDPEQAGYYEGAFDEGAGPEEVGVETVGFSPDEPLEFGARYRLELPQGTQGARGEAVTPRDFSAAFTVTPRPEVVSTFPENEAEAVDPWQTLQITFNAPMNPDTLVFGENLIIEPTIAVTQVYTYWWSSNTNLEINFLTEASSRYNVTLGPSLEGRYGQPLGQSTEIAWRTQAEAPMVFMHTPDRIATYNAYTDTIAYVGVRNLSKVTFSLYRLPQQDFIRLNGSEWWEPWDRYRGNPESNNFISSWELNVSPQLNATTNYRVNIGQQSGLGQTLPPGLYYLEATASGDDVYPDAANARDISSLRDRHMLVVSRHNITLKSSNNQALAWLTDLATGQPIAGAPVTFLTGEVDAREVGQVATDDDGVAAVEYDPLANPWAARFAFAGDPDDPDADFAVAVSHWINGVERYQFDNVSVEDYQQPYNGHFYTDRQIYRPGQTVHFKGIIRADNDANYSLPTSLRRANVAVLDSQGKEIFTDELPLSDFGTLHGSIDLDDNAALGFYSIQVNVGPDIFFSDDFQVAAYRRPEFLVSAETDQAEYTQGEKIRVSAAAEFFFGGPVSNAEVRWTLLASDYSFIYRPPSSGQGGFYDFTSYDASRSASYFTSFGETLAEGEGVTDAEGRFTFEVEADIADKINSQRFTFDIVVTDLNNQEVAGQAEAIVHKGLFYVGLRPEQYVSAAGQESEVNVLVVDWESEPVPDQTVQVVFAEHNWYSVQRQYEDGGFYWDSVVETNPVFTTTVATGRAGEAVASFTPADGGIYQVMASAADRRGNDVRSSTFLWVSGEEYVNWRQENNDRLALVADKREYNVGDTATVLVPHPYSGTVKALVTLERGHIYEHFVTEFDSNSEQLEIPITEDMIPNMYVSVVVVQGNQPSPTEGNGVRESPPDPPMGGESSQVPPSGGLGGPESGSTPSQPPPARGRSQNLPPSGGERGGENPSILPSFKVGYANLPINTQQKELQISLTPGPPSSSPPAGGTQESYQPGDAVEYLVNVADYEGKPVEAELSLALVDKAVLSLAPEEPGQLLSAFWRDRGLGIQTAGGLALAIDRINLAVAPTAKGGGGGFDTGFGAIRGDFRDTALWLADFVTDEQGEGVVEVTLPDNLTTWTMTGKGVTGAATLVGESRVEIVSTKPLLVRPVAPRFFVVGDEAQLGLIIQNNSDERLTAEPRFEAVGLEIGNWRLEGEDWRDATETPALTVEPGQRVKVEYQVTVQETDSIELTMGARSSRETYADALTFDLPVYRFSTPETVATAGVLAEDGLVVEGVALPRSFDPSQGSLTVDIDPSLAAGMRDGLSYLEHFPYECTEQTVSRFLPNVFTFRAYQQLKLDNPELEANLPGLVSVGLQRLYNQQHVDGGWGWFMRDDSHPYVTAYVLLGLVEAQRAGFSVSEDARLNAVNFLEDSLVAPKDIDAPWQANRQAFTLYALAEAGQGDLGRSVALFNERQKLDMFGRAYLAVAIHRLDEEAKQVVTLLDDITTAAVVSATGAHWEEAQVDYFSMNTDTRSTAIVIAALSRIQPEHPLLPAAVRWLMSVRENGGHWETTQETAWAIIGLTDWMVETGELEGNYAWTVTLNGEGLGEGVVNQKNIDETTKLRVEVNQLLADAVNRLAIARDPAGGAVEGSPGQLYYAAYLTTYRPVPEVKALDRGIIISRRYSLAEGESDQAIAEAKVGDVVNVKLTLIAPNDLHYVVVEDPFPAGAEGVDTSLATTSAVGQAPALGRTDRGRGYRWWYFSHSELRDEKAVLFATFLPKGTYEYTYQIRASLPGEFNVIPTHAEQMYFPEVFGRGDGGLFKITQ